MNIIYYKAIAQREVLPKPDWSVTLTGRFIFELTKHWERNQIGG
jgi:hypothetical protein